MRTADVCAGSSKTISCYDLSSQHSVFVSNAFFGVKSGTFCGYTPGDCTEEEMYNDCKNDENTCKVSVSNFKFLSNCGFLSRASYYHLDYFCVPCKMKCYIKLIKIIIENFFFQIVKTNQEPVNICSNIEFITSESGIIQSFYPVVEANLACEKVITVTKGKSINIWILDLKIGARDSDGNCQGAYVKITDSTGEYILCGTEKIVFHNKFCSSTIFIKYLSSFPVSSSDRGFKLYYETFDSSIVTGCPNDPATTISPDITTLPTSTPSLPPLGNLQASEYFTFQVCPSTNTWQNGLLKAPAYYTIYIEELYYGVTENSRCLPYDKSHCTVPAPITCTLQG